MTEDSAAPRGTPLRVGLALVLLEAVVLVVLGIAVVVASILDHGDLLGTNAGVLLVLVLIGGLLVLAVRGLWQGKRWGRGPVITWQLLQFAVAVTSWGVLQWWALVPALVLPVVVTICLLLPASLAATAQHGRPDGVL
ncbi:hypothetical protein [Ruania albidiflava]|uniref:hypothetical protein n=1 Tax=Ruania albidiflava TaxID=366586 RepID=UPI0004284BE7|nr:hypothetical protein [Ruania albidiflava]